MSDSRSCAPSPVSGPERGSSRVSGRLSGVWWGRNIWRTDFGVDLDRLSGLVDLWSVAGPTGGPLQ